MDDRKLLEAAAKAAGISGHYVENLRVTTDFGREVFTGILTAPDECWNPLVDLGAALRLAVDLRMHVCIEQDYTWTDIGPNEQHGNDPYAATCRAIVCAAAAPAAE